MDTGAVVKQQTNFALAAARIRLLFLHVIYGIAVASGGTPFASSGITVEAMMKRPDRRRRLASARLSGWWQTERRGHQQTPSFDRPGLRPAETCGWLRSHIVVLGSARPGGKYHTLRTATKHRWSSTPCLTRRRDRVASSPYTGSTTRHAAERYRLPVPSEVAPLPRCAPCVCVH